MLPYITEWGRTFPMYGVVTAMGLVLGVIFLKRRERQYKELRADGELVFVWSVIGTFLGAKILWLIVSLPEILKNIAILKAEPFLFVENYFYGGFVFYGGLIGCLAAVVLYCNHYKRPFFSLIESFFPIFPLIHAFGRVGCFCMGCCYGRPAEEGELGIAFHCSDIAPNGVPLIPVQLYEAGGVLLIFGVLLLLSRWNAGGRVMLGVYLVSYGILRFVLEFFRGDDYRGFLGPLSVSQSFSVVAVLVGFWILNCVRKKAL